MEVTYIYHSGFCIEFNDVVMIFDYFKGILPEIDIGKKVYVFASHKHHDHFDMKVFDLSKKHDNIKYIFGNDIRLSEKYLARKGINPQIKKSIFNMREDQNLFLDDLCITAFNSTDKGVAFLIEYSGKVIYHSGDLNWWHWENEKDAYNIEMEKMFKNEINKLKDRKIDIAFFPVDLRQGKASILGIDYFMRTANVSVCFPMHFWEDYTVFDSIKKNEKCKSYIEKIISIEHENQKFVLEDNYNESNSSCR